LYLKRKIAANGQKGGIFTKKLLILGGSRYILPVIKTAHELGINVITCDYLPNNVAHKFSDQYYNISVTDQNAVLKCAQTEKIDGIISFACDPGVVTAAYIAEKLGLPFQGSYESTAILQDKGRFRKFLADHHFNVPYAKRYTNVKEPFKDILSFHWPVIVKPVDSAGSKGVNRVDTPDQLEDAIGQALKISQCNAFIIEDYIIFEGYHSSADFFTEDGELKFATYSDQIFDTEAKNPYTPAYIIWPSSMKKEHQDALTDETQRLMRLLDMKTGIYNIETCVGTDGKPYLMEVSPRGGGCKIAEIQKMAYGVDLIENEVRQAVGLPTQLPGKTDCDGHWCELVVHARGEQSGILKKVLIDPEIERKYIKKIDIDAKEGDPVFPFTGANMALGDLFLRFDTRKELDEIVFQSNEWIKVELQ